MSRPIILNNDYAVTKTPEGWHVYGYIHSEDIPLGCVEDKFAGAVTLDALAAQLLADEICSEEGGCDFFKDAQAGIERMRNTLKASEQTLRNLGNGELTGDAATIALSAARNIRDVLQPPAPAADIENRGGE